MAQQFSNAARSALAAAIAAGNTALTVTAGDGAMFPALAAGDWYYAVLEDNDGIEIVRVTARAGDVMTVTRGQQGTVARAWAASTTVGLRLTAHDALGWSTPAPICLPGEVIHIWTSQQWTAPADGYLRACLSSGGGGIGYRSGSANQPGGGGASALAFWRWRKVTLGDTITIALGAAGSNGTASGAATNGGTSSITAPWGTMTADPGKAGAPASATPPAAGGSGGITGTGADYYYQGGDGFEGQASSISISLVTAGAAVNPFNLPKTVVSSIYNNGYFTAMPNGQRLGFNKNEAYSSLIPYDIISSPTSPDGWLSVINGVAGVGAGPFISAINIAYTGTLFELKSGPLTNARYGATNAPGFAILEFCKAL